MQGIMGNVVQKSRDSERVNPERDAGAGGVVDVGT